MENLKEVCDEDEIQYLALEVNLKFNEEWGGSKESESQGVDKGVYDNLRLYETYEVSDTEKAFAYFIGLLGEGEEAQRGLVQRNINPIIRCFGNVIYQIF